MCICDYVNHGGVQPHSTFYEQGGAVFLGVCVCVCVRGVALRGKAEFQAL